MSEQIGFKRSLDEWAVRAESSLKKKGIRIILPEGIFDRLGMLMVVLVAEICLGNSLFDLIIVLADLLACLVSIRIRSKNVLVTDA
jgi:hypothetical protein